MPQFSWYHTPVEVKAMNFSALFIDLYHQAARAGRPFEPRITRSMTEAEGWTDQSAWQPSQNQPEPENLGDFLRLLCHKFQPLSSPQSVSYHCTMPVGVKHLYKPTLRQTLTVMESSMKFSYFLWEECCRGGDLSSHGTWEAYRVYAERRLSEFARWTSDDWLLPNVRAILNLMWGATDTRNQNLAMQDDWRFSLTVLSKCWSAPLRSLMLLMTAMVSCQIPLSAAVWAREHFVPVLVQFGSLELLGLLAKHAVRDDLVIQPMLSAGRHPPGSQSQGTDIVLADPFTKAPVGLVPDFLYHQRTDEEYVVRIKALYGDFAYNVPPNGVGIVFCPLDAISPPMTEEID